MIAAAPALPSLTQSIGSIAIEQGRYEDGPEMLRSFEVNDTEVDDDPAAVNVPVIPGVAEDADELENGGYFPRPRAQKLSDFLNLEEGSSSRRKPTSFTASQTAPSLPGLGITLRQLAQDPLGQHEEPAPSSPIFGSSTPYMSTPSIHIHSSPPAPSLPDKLLRSLLRSHYCRSEVDFILALESIANRLLVVPKPARVSALRAELTSLNHKLPAEVSLTHIVFKPGSLT